MVIAMDISGKKLPFAVFICGAAVMVVELLGSRLLAPYMGTGIYTWASLIGVILGALSIGFMQEYATLDGVFGGVAAFPVETAGGSRQNIILLASKKDIAPEEVAGWAGIECLGNYIKDVDYGATRGLTDDYAPVEYLMGQAVD